MKLDEFEEMLNSAIGYLDNYITARAIRDLGYNLHFDSDIWGHNDTDDQPVKWRGIVGLEGVSNSYITVFDGTVSPNITRADLLRLYKPFLKELHKLAINSRYGLASCMPATVLDANTYTMEDTTMTYTLLNKPTRSGARWLAALVPKKIHFNGPATIVEWNDGTKTVVKCQKGDTFDPLTGVAMCCMKKMLGTNESGSNYLNDVSKLIDEALEAKNKRYKKEEEALKQKKEVADPDWNVIAEKLDKPFDKAIGMLIKSTDDMLNNCNQEDKT